MTWRYTTSNRTAAGCTPGTPYCAVGLLRSAGILRRSERSGGQGAICLRSLDDDAIATCLLRLIQRLIGQLDCTLRRPIDGRRNDTDAHTHGDLRQVRPICLMRRDLQTLHGMAKPFGRVLHVRERQVVENYSELLSSIARCKIQGPACEILYRLGDAAQRNVPGLVTERVVVSLEVIDVDHEYRDGALIAQRMLPDTQQMFIEGATVHQSGKPVAGGELTNECGLEKIPAGRFLDVVVNDCADGAGQRQDDRAVQ